MLRSLAALALTAALSAPFLAAPAFADDCGGSAAVDRCLVGKWQLTTNGMDAWRKKHLKNFRTTKVESEGNTITLNADGTFETGTSRSSASGTTADGNMSATSSMTAQASGNWSAADGKFNLCAKQSTMEGKTTVTAHGRSSSSPIASSMPAVATQTYSCAGETFSTTMKLTGDDVTSTYTKVK